MTPQRLCLGLYFGNKWRLHFIQINYSKESMHSHYCDCLCSCCITFNNKFAFVYYSANYQMIEQFVFDFSKIDRFTKDLCNDFLKYFYKWFSLAVKANNRNQCLVLLQVPKCFVPSEFFWACPKIWLHLVPLWNLLCWHKNQFYWMQIIFL